MFIGIDGNEANVRFRVGSGQYAFELLKQFYSLSLRGSASWRRRGNLDHQFVVYLKDQPLPGLPKESDNFKYKVFGPKKLWTQFALPLKLTFGLPREAQALWGSKPDVFFSMAHYGPRFSKVPYVVTIHDLSYLHFPKMFRKSDLVQLTSWSKYSIKNASHIISVSQTTKDDIVKNYRVDPSKITVTYEGYDQDRFQPQPKSVIARVKKKYKITANYVIFVGTLQPRKNLERLIEVFYRLTTPSTSEVGSDSSEVSKPALKLVICGKKGWLYDSIFAKVKGLGLEEKVIFTNYVPDKDLPALISGAKLYVLPSLWEGFGITVIEAQACGVPVVVSNTSSLPEIVGAKPNTSEVGSDSSEVSISGSGILINPNKVDSIAAGIKKALDPNNRRVLVKKGFANIKRFSWKKCAIKTVNVLEKAAIFKGI